MTLKDSIRPVVDIATNKTVVIIKRKALAEYYLNVSSNQMVAYTKANLYEQPLMPIVQSEYRLINSETPLKDRNAWYLHMDALVWHRDNVDQKNSSKKDKYSGLQDVEDISHTDYNPYVDKITTANMKIANELEKALNERLKREQSSIELEIQKKNYIPIEEADKTVAVSVRVMLSELYNMIENLPSRLNDCDNMDEIKNVLEDEFEDLIKEIKSSLLELSQDE